MKITLKWSEDRKNMVRMIPVFAKSEEGEKKGYTPSLYEWEREILQRAILDKVFEAKSGECYATSSIWEGSMIHTVFMGLGKAEDLTEEKLIRSITDGFQKASGYKCENIWLQLFDSGRISLDKVFQFTVQTLYFNGYSFDKYKSEKKDKPHYDVLITGIPEENTEVYSQKLEELELLGEVVSLARTMVNEPANVLYPKTLAKQVKEYAKEYGFEVEIREEEQIEELGMDAYLAVSKGSKHSPRLITMRYFGDPDNPSDILGLVGKGLTFDTGGYSIKPSDSMVFMKADMAGAAAVISAICAISKSKLKVNVVAVVAACENAISGKAYKPGDVITSMAGKTIEILNTDAEGRLTLADAVHYTITKEKATKIVDIATLTGAILVALGDIVTGALTNDKDFYGNLEEAAADSGERFWLLPSFEEYKELLKSDIADLKNIGGRNGGAITAGMFIKEFVGQIPWIHLDIAGTGYLEHGKRPFKDATGVGVKTLYYLAKRSQKNS